MDTIFLHTARNAMSLYYILSLLSNESSNKYNKKDLHTKSKELQYMYDCYCLKLHVVRGECKRSF